MSIPQIINEYQKEFAKLEAVIDWQAFAPGNTSSLSIQHKEWYSLLSGSRLKAEDVKEFLSKHLLNLSNEIKSGTI